MNAMKSAVASAKENMQNTKAKVDQRSQLKEAGSTAKVSKSRHPPFPLFVIFGVLKQRYT
jgi:hypothetical protein